jgi:lysophospholipase L1-like esterase
MTNLRISDATPAATLDGSELLPSLQGGNPRSVAARQLTDFFSGFQPGRIPKWRRALGNVAAGVSNAKVCIIGDSQVAGWGASGNVFVNARVAGWPAKMTQILRSCGLNASDASWMGDQNTFQQSTSLATYDPRITIGTGWVSGTGGLTFGAYALTGSGSGVVSFSPTQTFDTIEVYWAGYPGHGTFSIGVDGGAGLASVSTDVAASVVKTVVTCSRGTHTVDVARTGGGVVSLIGMRVYDSTVKEISIIQGGWSGAASASWNDAAQPFSPKPVLQYIAPDLTIIALCGNDWHGSVAQATFSANIQALITAAQVSGDVILMTDTNTNPATTKSYALQQPYLDTLCSLAASNGVPFVDIAYRWKSFEAANAAGWMSDQNHPSAAGYLEIAKLAASVVRMELPMGGAALALDSAGKLTLPADLQVSGNIYSVNYVRWTSGKGKIGAGYAVPGTVTITEDGGSSGAAGIALGGSSAAFPLIQREGPTTKVACKLGDNSAFAPFQAKLTTDTAYSAGTFTATGYLTLYDASGTAYRVPCAV